MFDDNDTASQDDLSLFRPEQAEKNAQGLLRMQKVRETRPMILPKTRVMAAIAAYYKTKKRRHYA